MQIPRRCDMDNAAPRREGPLAPEDWPFVLQQDMGNIYRQQAGYRSGAITPFDAVTQVRADDLLAAQRDRPLHCDVLSQTR